MTDESPSRVAIVTGGSAGLGRAMTLALLDAGHRVVAVGRSERALKDLGERAGARGTRSRLLCVAGDVRSGADCATVVARALERFGELHGVVNNAGINLPTTTRKGTPRFFDVSVDDWQAIFDTNVNGAFFITRAAAPHLLAAGWGRIVNNVTSYRTMVRGGDTPYGPSKAALEAATRAWASELEGSGVTVNAILPGGAADTRMIAASVVPDRGKLVPPEAMGPPITWLFSASSDGFTGQRILAVLWDPAATPQANLVAAASPAGWAESLAAAPGRAWPPP